MGDDMPSKTFEALKEVRDSGECNMFDRACVLNHMGLLGYVEEAEWLDWAKRYGATLTGREFSNYLRGLEGGD